MINSSTRVYGVIGDPVSHSLSPLMQNRAFAACGLNCCYLPFRVAAPELPAAVAGVRALGLGGINVTIPHKERVMAFLDEIDREALRIGAVNTVVNRDGRLIGHNTDGAGWLASLRDAGFDPGGRRVVLLGAGGAARAVSTALIGAGVASLAIFDLDCSRAETLASALAPAAKCGVSAGNSDGKVLAAGCEIRAGASDGEALAAAVAGADLLVNATPVGMFPEQEAEPPVETRRLPAGLLVYDLVYNPLRTRLLREAEQRGCRVLSGAEMLVRQGALAFELWTGQPAPVEVMRRALYEALQG